jgi:FMN phosphatase YigB (HAD superfamily)
MPPVRAVAFDWGGVFTEGTFDGRAIAALSTLLGRSEDQVARVYYPLMELFEVGAFDLPTFQQRLSRALDVEVDEPVFREAFLSAPRDRPAMFEVVSGVPERYAVAVLSNNVPELCDRVRTDPRLNRVEHFVFSNEIGLRKPDPGAFAALSEALALPAAATVFIDDNAANIAACEAMGFRGILLDSQASFAARWRSELPELAGLVAGPQWA